MGYDLSFEWRTGSFPHVVVPPLGTGNSPHMPLLPINAGLTLVMRDYQLEELLTWKVVGSVCDYTLSDWKSDWKSDWQDYTLLEQVILKL